MFTVKILALEIGMLLVYAGVTGRSVTALLKGDSTKKASNKELNTGIQQVTPVVSSGAPVSGYAQSSGANLH